MPSARKVTPRFPLAIPLTLLTAARLVVNTAHRFVYPFLPAIGRGLGISLEQAGLLVSVRWFAGLATPAVVLGLGRGERRRRLALVGLALFATGAALTAATNVYIGAIAGFVLMGLAKPAFDISAQAYVADRTPYTRRARYLSVLELTWAGSLLIGAPAAGWMIDRFGWASPFWVVSVLGALTLLAVARVLEPDAAPGVAAREPLRLDRPAVALLVVVALFTLAAEVMFVVFGAWLEDAFDLSLVALGGAATLIALSELTGEGATLAMTDRLGKRRSVAIGLVVSIVGFGLLAWLQSQLAAGLAMVAVGLAGFEFTIVSAIPLATEVKPQARARYLALMTVAMALGRTIGAAAGPVIFERFGLPANAIAAAVIDVVAIAFLLRWVEEHTQQLQP